MEHMGTLLTAQSFYKPKTALKCFLLIKNDTGNTHVVNSLYVPHGKNKRILYHLAPRWLRYKWALKVTKIVSWNQEQ